ncbi:hypothetical protein BDA99DRAFT_60847 [Phascolomyces articulosus]|uniref:C2H2-type domain-containing protein n=1 Tax=Phascolomyces articulosus TaxID=60185 RepID=A0AAD5PFM1_9FUNG|nr:hypothetical protein BDA99DRAFT_60847 [Phascolomyces articulosus]
MGYCARCGEISSSDKCQKCRGRSVASIATALDTIGRSSEGNSIRENILGERGHSKAGVTGPFPQTSNSTPVIPSGLNRRQCSSFTADQPPLSPSWAKPISKRQGAPASLRDIQPRDISEFINNNNKEPPFVTTSPTSVVPTALVENASNIQTARSGLLKSSTRNSSFFLKNANDSSRNENLTTLSSVGGIMSGSYSTTTTKPRPRLSTQLFHYDSANSSTMNSPATPVSPYNGNLMAHLSTKLAAPATTISDNGQSPRIIPKTKDQQLEEKQPNNINNINNDTVASNKKENNEQLTQQTKKKKKKICCKCNQPFGRSDGKGTRRRIGVPLSNGSQDDYAWYHYDCLRCPICNEQFTKHDYFVCHGQEVYHARCRKLLLKQNNDTTNNTDYLQEESDSSKSKCTVCSTSIKVGSDGNGFEYEGNNYYHFQVSIYICVNNILNFIIISKY